MKKITLLLLILAMALNANSQVTIKNDLTESTEMSQNLFGAFFEDINYGADGGLYAEMVQNRSFEYIVVQGYTSEGPMAHWKLAHSDNKTSSASIVDDSPLNENNTKYLKLTIADESSPNGNNEENAFKGKIGVGAWGTQAVFESVNVNSGEHVWLDEDFSDASNWDVRAGSFSVSEGTYVQSDFSTPAWSIAETALDTVYTYTVRAMKTGGDEGFLFPFAYLDDQNYYWLNIGGWGNTQHAVERSVSGAKTSLATLSGSIENNVWYSFKIEVTNKVCRMYMDDALLFEIDAPSSSTNDEVITLEQSGYAGIANTGYFGMAVESGKKYNFSAYLKGESGVNSTVTVNLHDDSGNVLATDTLSLTTTNWEKFDLELTSNATSEDAYLSLLFNQSGTVYADMISLFPAETFSGRANGLRKDLAQSIADLNPSFVRFPGGCVSHGRGLDNAYRWKETVGDVAERTPNWNLWNYHQTYGLGFYEYFLYCEDIGAKPLPVIPVGISCQFREREIEPIENMGPWIQDAVDLVEFANGDVTTTWGKVRADMGHPEPFNMEFLCLGNEEDDIPEFRERFIMFQDTLAKYCPEIKVIGTSGTDDTGSNYNTLWEFSKERDMYAVDEHYYNSPEWFVQNNHRYDDFDRNGPKVFIGEYASQDDRLFNAIAEAAYLTGVERNADIIEFTCYAPLLNYQENIPYHWHPDMILFDNTKLAKTTNYYVQQMYGQNTGDAYFNSFISYDSSADGVNLYDGQMGLGTWSTQAAYDDILVTSGEKVWMDEDFSTTPNDWTTISGSFSVVGGEYVQSGTASPAMSVSSVEIDTSAYTVTLKAKKTGGTEGFLIPFGFKNSDTYYWFNIGGWSNSQHALEVSNGGTKTALKTKAGSINTNQWYTIKMEITESISKFYIDNELIFELAPPDGPVTASLVHDEETNDFVLKLINTSSSPLDATVVFDNTEFSTTANLTVLTGATDARNSINNPDAVAPTKSTIEVSNDFVYNMPANSFSLMRFSADKIAVSVSDIKMNSNQNNRKDQVSIEPNPASNYINVGFKDNSDFHTVTLLNLQGKVQRIIENIEGNRTTIDTEGLASGTYIVMVSGDIFTSSSKVSLRPE